MCGTIVPVCTHITSSMRCVRCYSMCGNFVAATKQNAPSEQTNSGTAHKSQQMTAMMSMMVAMVMMKDANFHPYQCGCNVIQDVNVTQSHFTSQTMHNFMFRRSVLFSFRWIVNGNRRCRLHRLRHYYCWCVVVSNAARLHDMHICTKLTVTLLDPSSINKSWFLWSFFSPFSIFLSYNF